MTNATPKNGVTGAEKNNGSSKTTKPFTIGGIGEIAIHCQNLDIMTVFYENVLGLARYGGNENPNIRFFKISDGIAGHSNVLALFLAQDGAAPQSGETSTLHHFALSLPFEEQEKARLHFEREGVPFRVELFEWTGWRGLFLTDPEGNTVELVAGLPEIA